MTKERIFRVAGCVLVLAVMIGAILSMMLREPVNEDVPFDAGQDHSQSVVEVAQVEGAVSARQSPDSPAPKELVRCRILDFITHEPLAGLEVQVTELSGGRTSRSLRTDDDGAIEVERGEVGNTTIVSAVESVKILGPIKEVPSSSSIAGRWKEVEVLAFKRVLLRVDVALEDPAAASRPDDVRVIASPTEKQPGEWTSDPERAGSPSWMARRFPKLRMLRAIGGAGRYEVELSRCKEIAVVAWAKGHTAKKVIVDGTGASSGITEVSVHLEKAPEVTVKVVDSNGNACTSARVRLVMGGVYRSRDVSVHEEEVVAVAVSSAVGLDSAGDGEITRSAHAFELSVDDRGVAQFCLAVDHPDVFLFAIAPGFVPERRRVPRPKVDGEICVVMRAIEPVRPSYVLECDGVPVDSAEIQLVSQFEWVFCEMPSMRTDVQGRVSSATIVPGEEYFAFVSWGSVALFGRVTFGNGESVDISGFDR